MKLICPILLFIFFTSACAVFEPDTNASKGATYKSLDTKGKPANASVSQKTTTPVTTTDIKGVTKEGYTIQVGAFKNIKNAGAVVDELNRRGLDAFLYKDGKLYKVRFGNFKTFNEAKKVSLDLMNKNTIADYYIVRPEEYSANTSVVKGDGDYLRAQLVRAANAYRGVPYSWGGTTASSGFDCSGLTRAVYRLNGLDIPRVSVDQFSSGVNIKLSHAKQGDLVFFATSGSKVNHVGVYIGNNQFIHAPSSGKVVRSDDINNSYWKKRFKGARTYL